MDISTIYTGNKLYKITAPAVTSGGSDLKAPIGFNGLAILYEYEADSVMPSDMAAFLEKVIAGGMKLDPADVFTANLCYSNASLQKVADNLKAKTIIIFGLKWLNGLQNANIRKNEIVKLYGMKLLVTDSLDIINTNEVAKKAFWAELKKIF
jgi:hypothetical protein